MNLLCFDISSGGISAALLDEHLEVKRTTETQWELETGDQAVGAVYDRQGEATISVQEVVNQLKNAIHALQLSSSSSIDAICIGTFMHNCVLLNDADQPLTPVFTWLDHRGNEGLEYIRSRLGDRFHDLTGCRYHPMFPVFKLAAIRLADPKLFERARRVVSIKTLLLHRLSAIWIEDHGMASASGLFNVRTGDWDPEVLSLVGLDRRHLPAIIPRTEVVGTVTSNAAAEFGLTAGVPVVAGSGDGFLANMGSDCEVPSKIAVTLGTSAVARQTLNRPVLNSSAGTFCYRADANTYLLGCAGSNGGNVLDWGRKVLETHDDTAVSGDLPIFIPLLHGERSPEWDPSLTGSWHGLTARHTAADLSRSILEGVIFNLAHFVEIVQQTSGEKVTDLVLSGNGFLDPIAAPTLATVTSISTSITRPPGLASLRGAGICALRALKQPSPALQIDRVSTLKDPGIFERYTRYRHVRSSVVA